MENVLTAPTTGRSFSDLARDLGVAVPSTPAKAPVNVPVKAPAARLALPASLPMPAAPEPYTTAFTSTTIYQTTDYDQFKFLPANRPVDPKHVRSLKALIAENNQLQAEPLDVSPNMEVLDGQHRLTAARELGLPVFFRYSDQRPEDALKTMNRARKNWEGVDWLHHYTALGLPSYVALTAFRERHPRLSFSNAKMMLSGTAHNSAPEFRAGLWEKQDETRAELVAELVERIAGETPFRSAMHTGFVAAVYHCVANVEGFDPKEFMRKILQQPRALVACASHKQYLAMFSDIYNYRTAEANRVRFA